MHTSTSNEQENDFAEKQQAFQQAFKEFQDHPESFHSYFDNMKEIDAWIKKEFDA